MNRTPPILDRIADVVLAYRPPDKKKKLAAKAKQVAKEQKSKQKKSEG